MHEYQEHTCNDCQQKRNFVAALHDNQNWKKDTGQQRRCNTCIQNDDQQDSKENNVNSNGKRNVLPLYLLLDAGDGFQSGFDTIDRRSSVIQ